MDSFYTVKGEEVSQENIVNHWISNYTGGLTDFNEGSEIRNLLEAFAVYAMGLEERLNDLIYIMDIMNADGEYLDLLASQPRIGIERIEGVPATGDVTFTLKGDALDEDLLIPAGTIVTSDTGLDFETVTDNTILPGETSRDCAVEAIDVGVDGNIPANSIITNEDGYDTVEGFTVSNSEAFIGGVDYEEDDVFRERIIAEMSLQKFGSKAYYVSVLRDQVNNVHDLLFEIDDSGTYTAIVTPNTYLGDDAQAALEQEMMAYLTNEDNILCGHKFNVVSPGVKEIAITIADEGAFSDLEDEVKDIVTKYITGGSIDFAVMDYAGLNLGVATNPDDLKNVIRTIFPLNDYLGELTITITDDGVFDDGENKYEISSITFDHTTT